MGIPSVSNGQIAQLFQQGFIVLKDILDPADVLNARQTLDALFCKFDKLPARKRVHLDGPRKEIKEINRPTELLPALKSIRLFKQSQQIASQILGRTAYYAYDHAIYKSPRCISETAWHQDQAYTLSPISLSTIHMWIPLQTVTIESGCMRFIPYSHKLGLLPHHFANNESSKHALTTDEIVIHNQIECPIEIGSMTIHLPLTLHSTGANRTGDLRRAWIIHFGPYGRLEKYHPKHVFWRMRNYFIKK